jgi:hypothetical protein
MSSGVIGDSGPRALLTEPSRLRDNDPDELIVARASAKGPFVIVCSVGLVMSQEISMPDDQVAWNRDCSSSRQVDHEGWDVEVFKEANAVDRFVQRMGCFELDDRRR